MKVDAKALELARAKWQSSGLTDTHAKRLRFRPLGPDETGELGKFHPVRALHIPYFDPSGSPTKFFRIRYLEKLPGEAGVVEKPQRYAQPGGTLNEVYLPTLLDMKWADVFADTSITIYITEGELKAACACAHKFACMGLGGVDMWLSSKRGIPILPTLKEVKWQNREVVIVYDSDAATNPNVVRAQRRLAGELAALGARPRIAALPAQPDGGKQGLDDLIVNVGPEALAAALAEAPAYAEADALWQMNEEVIYIRNPGFVVLRETGQKVDPGSFVSHTFANRHYMALEITKDGRQTFKKKKLAPRWIEWEQRHELSGMTYAPGKPQIVDDMWNTWPGWGVDPVKGDVDPWHELCDLIFKGHPDIRQWFERWAAYPLQFPGAKLYTAPLLWGLAHGTGKTMLFYALMKLYGKNAIEIKNRHLKGGFNAWQENRQFVYGDEIEGGGDVGSKKIDSEWLKGLITQEFVTINQKFLPEYSIPDVMNYGFSSNKPDAAFMDDKDRRFMIHEVTAAPRERAFYDRIDRWLKGAGPAHLFYYLLRLNLGSFHPLEHAPMTDAKKAMIMNAKSDAGLWCVGLREDPESTLAVYGAEVAKGCDLFTNTQLKFALDGTINASLTFLGKELQKAGLRQINAGNPVRTCKGTQRLYAVRNVDRWLSATPKQAADHFNSFFGEGTKKHG